MGCLPPTGGYRNHCPSGYLGTDLPTPQADPDRGDPAADGETPLTTVLSEGPEGPRLQLLRRLVEAMADPHQARRGDLGRRGWRRATQELLARILISYIHMGMSQNEECGPGSLTRGYDSWV